MVYYSIGEISNRTGINISTLRYYDKEGLFPTMGRSNGGIRVFTDTEINAIKVIECLKATGMPIKDIKQFMDWCKEGDASLHKRQKMYNERFEIAQRQLEEAQERIELIKYKCWYYDTALERGTEAGMADISPDELPEGIHSPFDTGKS